jgi:perosamine synthetase
MPIPVVKPSIKRKDLDAVLSCLVSDQIAPGSQHEALVTSALELFNLDGGIAFRDPQTGIQHMISCLGLAKTSRIGLSILAPKCYLQSIRNLGLDPVFFDVLSDAGTINVENIINEHQQNPLSSLCIHSIQGFSGSEHQLLDLGIPLLEDVTENLQGSYTSEVAVGQLGNFIVLRMEPEDLVTAGGGVLILTKSKKESKQLNQVTSQIDHMQLMTDLNASLGVTQLKELTKSLSVRREIYEVLLRAAMRSHHKVLTTAFDGATTPYSFIVKIQGSLQDAKTFSMKKGIETTQAFAGSSYEYLQKSGEIDVDVLARKYPNAAQLYNQSLRIPLFSTLSSKEIQVIEKVLISLP